jgi:phosphoribosylaminoimidazolecarboxamide formyltransferase/IMP cyclohydrolase
MKALISVFNKDKAIEFAKALNGLGIEIIATEGTAKGILKRGTPVTKISEFTGFQEMLGGKVKTLHPRIHAAIATAEIGIVAVNLIPLDFSTKNPLNSMDIGGVAMLRSGIKNFEHVAVIVNPARYEAIIEELGKGGELSQDTKLHLAREASEYILAYESKIDMILKSKEDEIEQFVIIRG